MNFNNGMPPGFYFASPSLSCLILSPHSRARLSFNYKQCFERIGLSKMAMLEEIWRSSRTHANTEGRHRIPAFEFVLLSAQIN